ncbi:MAG: hypothetical protein ACPLYF_05135 [Fervidobacterium sp.]
MDEVRRIGIESVIDKWTRKRNVLEYSFQRPKFTYWVGYIGLRVFDDYFENILAPSLKKEGWDFIILFNCGEDEILDGLCFCLYNNMLPTHEFLYKRANLFGHDAFLIKLRKTGVSMTINEWFNLDKIMEYLMKELKVENRDAEKEIEYLKHTLYQGRSYGNINWSHPIMRSRCLSELNERGYTIERYYSYDATVQNMDTPLEVVDGEVEAVEIKCSTSPRHQLHNYLNQFLHEEENILKHGIPLRLIYVHIIAFEKNRFEIDDRLLEG